MPQEAKLAQEVVGARAEAGEEAWGCRRAGAAESQQGDSGQSHGVEGFTPP